MTWQEKLVTTGGILIGVGVVVVIVAGLAMPLDARDPMTRLFRRWRNVAWATIGVGVALCLLAVVTWGAPVPVSR